MSPAATPRKTPADASFAFRREHFGLVAVLLALLGVANLMVAIVTSSEHWYRLIPCWLILMMIVACSSALKDMKAVAWFATVATCIGLEFLRYGVYHHEILVRTFLSYAPLTAFTLVLFSNAVEEQKTAKEHHTASLKKLRKDSSFLLDQLKKLRSGELDQGAEDLEKQLTSRKACFEIYREVFPEILRIRYKRDIPALLERVCQQGFGLQAGILYEIPEDKQSEVLVRAQWGLAKTPKVEEAVARYAKGDLVRRVADERAPFGLDQIQRQPVLFEEYDEFAKDLFTIETVIPTLLLGRTLFVMFVGMPSSRGRVPYDAVLLQPIVQGCGQAISKLAQKDGRKKFSTFGA